MKLPWQQPPGLAEGCSSVSVGWLADMLADGPSQLLGGGGIGPPPTSWEPASGLLPITAHRRQRAWGCPTWTSDLGPQLVSPLTEQVGKLRRKLAA